MGAHRASTFAGQQVTILTSGGIVIGRQGGGSDAGERTPERLAEKLRECEQTVAAVAAISPGMLLIGRGAAVSYVDKRFEEDLGYTQSELRAQDFDIGQLVAAEDRDSVADALERHADGEKVPPTPLVLTGRKGQRLDAVMASAVVEQEEEPQVLGIVCDVTATKRAESRVDLQTAILDQVADPIIAIDNDYNVIYLNAAAADRYDVSREEVVGRPLEEVHRYHWLFPEQQGDALAALRERGYWSGQTIHVTNSGERLFVESTVSVLMDSSGQRIGMLAVIRDVTRRKRAEEEVKSHRHHLEQMVEARTADLNRINEQLQQQIRAHNEAHEALMASEHLHRTTLGHISDAVVITDDDGSVTFASPNTRDLFGCEDEEVLLGRGITGLLGGGVPNPKELEQVDAIRNIEVELRGESGEARTLLVDVRRVSVGGGTLLYGCHDITELKAAERRLRSLYETGIEVQKARTSARVYEIVGRGMSELGMRGYVLLLNPNNGHLRLEYTNLHPELLRKAREAYRIDAANLVIPYARLRIVRDAMESQEAIFYPSATEILAEILAETVAPEQLERIVRTAALTQGVVSPLIVKGESIGVLVAGSRSLRATDAPVVRLFATQVSQSLETIELNRAAAAAYSELKEAQTNLIVSEKMAAVGELSTSIAHEIRNPLAAIYNSIDDLRSDLELRPDQRRQMNVAVEAMEKLSSIVDDFLAFARPRRLSVREANIQDIIDDTVMLLRQDERFRSDVTVDIHYEEQIPAAYLDVDLIPEVLINILINAVQAMPGGGRILVAVGRALMEGRDAIRVEVTDSGEGIQSDALERVFQPFFTTKSSGTGLGLAIAYRIVHDHGGRIEVRSQVGVGTTFTVYLPMTGGDPHD
jgi:PAS domain S-box-containing protein